MAGDSLPTCPVSNRVSPDSRPIVQMPVQMMRPIMSYARLPAARRASAREAARELVRAWALVRFRHFSAYSASLGTAYPGDPEWEWVGDARHLGEVKWAVERITRLTGGRFTCLMKAMAGQVILARRGVDSAIVLGVHPSRKGSDPKAHAWLRVGKWIVLGGEERSGHLPVTSYRSQPRKRELSGEGQSRA